MERSNVMSKFLTIPTLKFDSLTNNILSILFNWDLNCAFEWMINFNFFVIRQLYWGRGGDSV